MEGNRQEISGIVSAKGMKWKISVNAKEQEFDALLLVTLEMLVQGNKLRFRYCSSLML